MAQHVNVNVSMECFNEIANALEAKNIQINKENPITITKDISIKGPIDYRQVQIRRDVLIEVVKVYEPPMSILSDGDSNHLICKADSNHFVDFLDDVYNYVLKGTKPPEKQTATVTPIKPDKKVW